ncbi:MAG: hypothetical protein AAB602_01165 [Patescibacteria group bacterium]
MGTTHNIWLAVQLVAAAIASGTRGALARAHPYPEKYVKGLERGIAWTIALPLLPAAIGVYCGLSWLTAMAGLMWLGAFGLLAAYAAPLGILIGSLWEAGGRLIDEPEPSGSGFFLWRWIGRWIDLPGKTFRGAFRSVEEGAKRYVGFVRGIALAGVVVSFLLSIVPVRNNILAVPLLLVAGALVWLSMDWKTAGGFWKKTLRATALGTVVVSIALVFLPGTVRAIGGKLKLLDPFMKKAVETNGRSLSTNGIFGARQMDTNLIVYRVFLGETNVFIPDNTDIVKIDMSTDRFTGWINIPMTWRMGQWRADANKGVFVQAFGEKAPEWIPPNATKSFPSVAFRLKGEGTVTLRGRR